MAVANVAWYVITADVTNRSTFTHWVGGESNVKITVNSRHILKQTTV